MKRNLTNKNKHIEFKYLLGLFLFYSLNVFSQTGPGGVGTNDGSSDLVIWYRSDNGIGVTGNDVDTWVNSAGYTEHNLIETGSGTQPIRVVANVNGYDEVRFNRQKFLYTSAANLTTSNFVTNQASSFITTNLITRTTSNTYGTYPLNSNRFNAHIPWSNNNYFFDIGQCCGSTARINGSQTLASYSNYSVWSYGVNAATGKQVYRNGTLLRTVAGTSNFTRHSQSRFQIGQNYIGNISEVVIFKSKVNNAERIIIQNYLSAKYNISLTSDNIFTQDNSANGNFDHHVAGIGQASDGSNHLDSQGTGIVRINTPNDVQNNEYLFWGEDEINSDYSFAALPSPSIRQRITTKWRVSERGNVGAVNFAVNATDLDFSGVPDGTLRLVRSTVADFSSIDEEYTLTLAGGVYSVSGVQFNNNDYFTLESIPLVDLSLKKTVDKQVPKVGDIIIFTLTVQNNGPNDATNVVVKDVLPAGLTYNMPNSNITTGTYDNSTGNWNVGTITNGSSVSIQIAATVNSHGLILNTSEIINLDQVDPDSIPSNGN